ncbi:hypothetical protein Dsin_028033 [Dipteronia sinensis]|uniref:Uncharacterized protein n=1 Tax=Dipteronia sinensis TaxID=43782 RepID=A0AAE0DV56_9ROSI|nr:hypothetical protein Dsin_028033 [Dipteronia sinensis]
MVFNKRFFRDELKDRGLGLEEEEHVYAVFTILYYLYSFCASDFVPCFRWKFDLDGHEKAMKKVVEIIGKYHEPIIEEMIRQ